MNTFRIVKIIGLIFFVQAIVLPKYGYSSPQTDPLWSLKFGENIRWQKITPLGNLVVSTSKNLYGVSPDKGEIIWEMPSLANLPEDEYSILPRTFFVEISSTKGTIIFDPDQGRLIADTQSEGYKTIFAKNVLYESGTILIFGVKEKFTPVISLYDISSGKNLWSNGEIFGKPKNAGGALFNAIGAAAVASNNSQSGAAPEFDLIEIGDDSFILATTKGIYKIATESGELLWQGKMPQPKGMVSSSEESKLIKSTGGSNFYYAKANYVMAYDIKTGKQVWPQIVKISGLVSEVVNHPKGAILLPKIDAVNNLGGIKANLVNPKTGETYWGKKGKGIKIPASVVDHQFLDGNTLLVTMSKEGKSFINVLDINAGALKFENSLKISGGLEYSELTPSGVLYITSPAINTSGEVNIFNINTGKTVFPKSIKSGKALSSTNSNPDKFKLLRVFDGSKLYVFSNKENTLYQIDLAKGALKTLANDLKLEGKEKPSSLEIRDDGLLLVSEQNIVKVGFSGGVLLRQYYPAPTEPGIVKALYAMNAVRAALYSAQYQMASAAFSNASQNTTDAPAREITQQISNAFDEGSDHLSAYASKSMAAAKQRFKASTNTEDFVYMMTTLEKENTGVAKAMERKRYGLVRVKKLDGKIKNTINMNYEKDPSYQVDNISNAVYYRTSPNEIVCYRY